MQSLWNFASGLVDSSLWFNRAPAVHAYYKPSNNEPLTSFCLRPQALSRSGPTLPLNSVYSSSFPLHIKSEGLKLAFSPPFS